MKTSATLAACAVLALASFAQAQGMLSAALLTAAGAAVAVTGAYFKFTLITRAAYYPGFSLVRLPVRGVPRSDGKTGSVNLVANTDLRSVVEFRQLGVTTPFEGLAGTIFTAFIGAVVLLGSLINATSGAIDTASGTTVFRTPQPCIAATLADGSGATSSLANSWRTRSGERGAVSSAVSAGGLSPWPRTASMAKATSADSRISLTGKTTPLGFEPRMRESKSLVLPLHYGVTFLSR